MSRVRRWAPLVVIWLGTIGSRQLAAQHDSTAARDSQPSIKEQVEQLDQRVRILARLLELKQDSLTAAAAATKGTARVTTGREGFTIKSVDGDFQLRLRGLVQADSRSYGGGAPALGAGTLFLRRVRPITDVTAWHYFTARIVPDFGAGTTVLYDAYVDFRLAPQFTLRGGKAKPPVGLEQLQSDQDLPFVERGLPTNLVPNRDVGLQALGDFAGGALSYAAGVFDGDPDRGNVDGDVTNNKDIAARLFLQPFVRSHRSPLQGLGFGVAGTTGIEHGTIAATALPSYVTPGQQTMFKYRDSTTAQGRRYRVTPQAYWYVGRVGLLGEYVVSSQRVARGAANAVLQSTAWQVEASIYLTNDHASFGTVTPRHPFDPRAHGYGALELSARYGELTPDAAAFPTFATVATAATEAKAWAVDLTWRFAPAVQLGVTYEVTQFTGGVAAGNRASEHFLAARLQQAF